MKRASVCLFCISALLGAPLCAGAVGKTNVDPNTLPRETKAASMESTDKRLDQKVTLVVSHKSVKTVLAILTKTTRVMFRAGYTSDDWQVRDRKMTIAVREAPLSQVMDAITRVMKFKWSKNTDVDPPTYRLYMDRRTLLGDEAEAYHAQQTYEDLCKRKREDYLKQISDLGNMSDADAEKLKDTNPYLYLLHQRGSDKLINAMFDQIPGLAASFVNQDTNLDTSASVLSDDAQQQLLHVIMEKWKINGAHGGNGGPFPADKIGPIGQAELMMEVVPRPYNSWSEEQQHWRLAGIGVYLKDGFHHVEDLRDPNSPSANAFAKDQLDALETGDRLAEVQMRNETQDDSADEQDRKVLSSIFPTEPDVVQPDEPDLHKKLKDIKPASEKLDDVLTALGEVSGFSIVSDSFASVRGSANLAGEIELRQALDAIARGYRCTWEKQGPFITFRNKNWFSLRMSQLPDERVAVWLKDINEHEFLGLDSFADIALLDPRQIDENVKPDDIFAAAKVVDWPLINMRDILRLYANLDASQKKMLLSPSGLPLRALQPHQIEAARKAFRYRGEGRADLVGISDVMGDEKSPDMVLRATFLLAGKVQSACEFQSG